MGAERPAEPGWWLRQRRCGVFATRRVMAVGQNKREKGGTTLRQTQLQEQLPSHGASLQGAEGSLPPLPRCPPLKTHDTFGTSRFL